MSREVPRLLVVDDEEGVIEMVRSHFAPRGFEVFTAGDGREAIEICRQAQPDLVLLDLKMKEMDGDEALPYLKKEAPNAKFFIVSAYQSEVAERRIRGCGIEAYFEKPVSILHIEKVLRAALS